MTNVSSRDFFTWRKSLEVSTVRLQGLQLGGEPDWPIVAIAEKLRRSISHLLTPIRRYLGMYIGRHFRTRILSCFVFIYELGMKKYSWVWNHLCTTYLCMRPHMYLGMKLHTYLGMKPHTWVWNHIHGYETIFLGMATHTWVWNHIPGCETTHLGVKPHTWVWNHIPGFSPREVQNLLETFLHKKSRFYVNVEFTSVQELLKTKKMLTHPT
jgi:hypothetical protein